MVSLLKMKPATSVLGVSLPRLMNGAT